MLVTVFEDGYTLDITGNKFYSDYFFEGYYSKLRKEEIIDIYVGY